ncbi:MAG: hypothetical protein F6J99_31695, partial [Moorea sp. SIO4G3]|nr:hypothetical protein [Moorena sp. SIO4G3]
MLIALTGIGHVDTPHSYKQGDSWLTELTCRDRFTPTTVEVKSPQAYRLRRRY